MKTHCQSSEISPHPTCWTTAPHPAGSPRRSKATPSSIVANQHCGVGVCSAHQGELVQGVIRTSEGVKRRVLLTCPRPDLVSHARFVLDTDSPAIHGAEGASKANAAVRKTLDFLGRNKCGGQFLLNNNIDSGHGNGASTADVVAVTRAVADACGIQLPPEDQARIAVAAEGASDGIMFDEPVLFAQREGVVVERFAGRLPPRAGLNFDTDPEGPGVDTLALKPANFDDDEIMEFGVVIAAVRHAIHHRDVDLMGRATTASARLNQRFLPLRHFAAIDKIRQEVGAAGIHISHSGTVAGMIWRLDHPELNVMMEVASEALRDLGCGRLSSYTVY